MAIFVIFFTLAIISLATLVIIVRAATTPTLGAATTYGVLATTYTNSSVGTTINGDVGFTVGPTIEPDPIGGHTNYGNGLPYATAGADQASAASALNSQACTTTFPAAVDLFLDATHGAPGVYTPGVYCAGGAITISGSLTLNGSGTYIFRSVGALDTTAGITVTLAGGASACDIFWTPGGDTTLGANTAFKGTVIDNGAITIGANAVWIGRALAFNGAVTSGDSSSITVPTCPPAPATLRVVKQVTNDNGGNKTAPNFTTHVTLAGADVAGSPATGTGSPGTSYTLPAGTYVISEDTDGAYAQSFSGDCNTSGSITLAPGEDKTCTITNNDIPATITVVKLVINDNGRTKATTDFPLFVSGTPVTSGSTTSFAAPGSYTITETLDPNYTQTFAGDCNASGHLDIALGDAKTCIITNNDTAAPITTPPVPPLISVVKTPSSLTLPSGPGSVTDTYTLTNIGEATVTNITMADDSCSPITHASGDTNNNSQLEVSETWIFNCTHTVTATHTNTNTITATAWANGVSTADIARATTVVGSSLVPPLITVTKVPSPLTLVAGGGMVTYVKKITNPGAVPLSNVQLTDDHCSPLTFVSGDTNSNTLLDTTEIWTYNCQADINKTTTNVATASGQANGMVAKDIAIATVVVAASAPKFPNTAVGKTTMQPLTPTRTVQ